jgi:hypothetical protein
LGYPYLIESIVPKRSLSKTMQEHHLHQMFLKRLQMM